LEEVFASVGVDFSPVIQDSTFTLGRISFEPDENQRQKISNLSNMNAFGKAMGYKLNDVILSINGAALTVDNADAVLVELYKTAKVGDPLQVVVLRKGTDGVEQKVTLSAPMMKVARKMTNVLRFNPNASAEQLALQESWLEKM
jgi:S1-C subfamily serine protease